ncbi:PilW family protein [Archangium violaceum]|uniref:PilW family protein n=1 Tax=Archangium violaceum TaxID=83451 RepID=UPI002B2E5345|nr:PilW family protein [Archangium gephyra]
MRRHQRTPDPLRLARRRRSARGLTLVELLLSAALGIVMLGAAVAVLLAAGRMRRNQQLLSDANEEARTALRQVSRAIAAAGAGGSDYSFTGEDGSRQQRPAILFTNGAVALHDGDMPQRPDTLTLVRYGADRRTVLVTPLASDRVSVAPDGRLTTTPGVQAEIFQDGESALITNFQQAMLVPFQAKNLTMDGAVARNVVQLDMPGAVNPLQLQDPLIPIQPGATVFPVRVVRFRVMYVEAVGKTPARTDLVMETLNPRTLAPLVPPERTVLAKDIEDFQVQWGYDNNNDGAADDGFSDQGPTTTPTDPRLTFARISISARTSSTLVSDQGEYVVQENTPFERGIDLGGAPRPEADGHRRRVLSTVVLLKNVAATRI